MRARGRRPTIKELDVDTSGYIQGIEDSEFSTPRELGRLLAESKTCQKAIVKQLFRYAFGRQETGTINPSSTPCSRSFVTPASDSGS